MAPKAITKSVADDYFSLVQDFPLIPIRSKAQLKRAYAVIDELTRITEANLTHGQSEYLEVLGDLTLKFEGPSITEEVREITGLDLLKHLMEANEQTASDIGRVLGQRELGSKIVRGDRQISKSHAKVLGKHFGLSS